MGKRPRKTPTLTLGCGPVCAKVILILALFIPAFSFVSRPQSQTIDSRAVSDPEGREEGHDHANPRELVKIYSIIRSHSPEISELEIWKLSAVIHEESSKRHLDPLLVLALIQVESGFQTAVVSPMGARGMMQIMPDTGKFLTESLAAEYGFHPVAFKPESLDDPVVNLRLGIYYLHDLKKQFQHLHHALTAYNYGPSHTQSLLESNLELSDEFATQVLATYRRYQQAKPPIF